MNSLSPAPENRQEPFILTQQPQRNKGGVRILHWWYGITSPSEPDVSAPFEERELFRRGRTGSQISIVLFILTFISFPATLAGSNSLLIVILAISLLVLIFALVLNRLRMVNTAGILVVLSSIAAPTANILTTPGGVNTSALPIFGFLVLPLMCTVSFLSPGWVFVVAAGNCLFTLCVLRFMPSSGELHEVLQVGFPGIVTPIILSQWIVSIVAFLWVRGARLALLRADQAEEVTRLLNDLTQRDHAIAVQKMYLDASIQQIELVHEQVANGNITARVPLTQDNVLWSIGGKLNNLLTRFYRLHMQVSELQQTNFSLQQALEEQIRLHARK